MQTSTQIHYPLTQQHTEQFLRALKTASESRKAASSGITSTLFYSHTYVYIYQDSDGNFTTHLRSSLISRMFESIKSLLSKNSESQAHLLSFKEIMQITETIAINNSNADSREHNKVLLEQFSVLAKNYKNKKTNIITRLFSTIFLNTSYLERKNISLSANNLIDKYMKENQTSAPLSSNSNENEIDIAPPVSPSQQEPNISEVGHADDTHNQVAKIVPPKSRSITFNIPSPNQSATPALRSNDSTTIIQEKKKDLKTPINSPRSTPFATPRIVQSVMKELLKFLKENPSNSSPSTPCIIPEEVEELTNIKKLQEYSAETFNKIIFYLEQQMEKRFGEYVCWDDDEFDEDKMILYQKQLFSEDNDIEQNFLNDYNKLMNELNRITNPPSTPIIPDTQTHAPPPPLPIITTSKIEETPLKKSRDYSNNPVNDLEEIEALAENFIQKLNLIIDNKL